MASNVPVVVAALVANGLIAVLKFIGFLITGSPSMFSETYHSISDTGNQVFLLIGIFYSRKKPSNMHPFGYGKAQFFYSFLVSVFLFGIAGWESVKHGFEAIQHPEPVTTGMETVFGYTFPSVYVNYGVLIGAILFESYAFKKAYTEIQNQINRHGWSGIKEAFYKTSDVTTLTALTEDTIALAGAGIALFGIYLSRITNNPIYDAVSAFIIGIMLMSFAVALAWENKRLLLGESLPRDVEDKIRDKISRWEGIQHIDGFKSVYFGPEKVTIVADITFKENLDTDKIDNIIKNIEDTLKKENPQIKNIYIEPEI